MAYLTSTLRKEKEMEKYNRKMHRKICGKLFMFSGETKIIFVWAVLAAIPPALYWISGENSYKDLYRNFSSLSAFFLTIYFARLFIIEQKNKIKKILEVLHPGKKFAVHWKIMNEIRKIKTEIDEKIPFSRRDEVLELRLRKYFCEDVLEHVEK